MEIIVKCLSKVRISSFVSHPGKQISKVEGYIKFSTHRVAIVQWHRSFAYRRFLEWIQP